MLQLGATIVGTRILGGSDQRSEGHAPKEILTRLSNSPVLFGTALRQDEIRDVALSSLIARECQLIVPSGPLHWKYLRPSPDNVGASPAFDFSRADACFEFARKHSLGVRGHTLVWHEMLPAWLPARLNSSNALSLLSDHIQRVVGRYRGRVHSWDVTNEVIDVVHASPRSLRMTIWRDTLGPYYPHIAFELAGDADPTARLGCNEYGLEADNPGAAKKRAALLDLVSNLKRSRVPIHYVGLQAHLKAGDSYSPGGLGKFLQQLRDLGVEAYITELDIDDRALPPRSPTRDEAIADQCKRFLSVALSAVHIPVVVTWGLRDSSSWLQSKRPRRDGLPQRPLPFDNDLRAKRFWTVLRSALTK